MILEWNLPYLYMLLIANTCFRTGNGVHRLGTCLVLIRILSSLESCTSFEFDLGLVWPLTLPF
jgi:hypothetical protein